MRSIAESVSQQRHYLKVLLAGASTAHLAALGKDPVIASSGIGPWERIEWLDHAAKDLQGANIPVRITKENERRNWIEVLDGETWIRFAPYFATLRSDDTYEIHAKGREKDIIQPLQLNLPGIAEPIGSEPSDLFGYALRTFRDDLEGQKAELHLVYGEKPARMDYMHDRIKWVDRYIVTMDDDLPSHSDVYEVPFDPEGL